MADAAGPELGIGPLVDDDRLDDDFSSWSADLAAATRSTYWSVGIGSARSGVFDRTIDVASETITKLASVDSGGEANFRFAAGACIRPSTPFLPVAYHAGPPAFALALESAALVGEAFNGAGSLTQAAEALHHLLEGRFGPVERLAIGLARESSRRYSGLDLSPAPSLEVSIAKPIEDLSGRPFGAPSTLAACAAVTRGLDAVSLQRCGYCGLMLPLLEDRVLARRASEGRFGVRDLLLCSSVCGTGLDVIPLPGDCEARELRGLILDVASVAVRWNKPLSARLLPIPGRRAGDGVDFANPHLTSGVVLSAS